MPIRFLPTMLILAFLIADFPWLMAAQKPCQIPTGDQFQRTKYGLVGSSARQLFNDSAFDERDWFRAGAQVPDSVKVFAYCKKDVDYDAIRNMQTSFCRNGSWAPALPACLENVTCGAFPIARGYPSERRRPGTSYADGHVIKFRCRTGERLVGFDKIICQDGAWSDIRFICIKHREQEPGKCGRFPFLNAIASERFNPRASYPNGHVIKFTCHRNKQLVGNNTIVCQRGRWSNVQFKCIKDSKKRRCKALRIAWATPDSNQPEFKQGTEVRYTCISGWQMIGTNNKLLCKGGHWSKLRFSCVPGQPARGVPKQEERQMKNVCKAYYNEPQPTDTLQNHSEK